MEPPPPPHFLLATFPLPSHINPALYFAKRLVAHGARVTFVTTIYGHNRMIKSSPTDDPHLSFASFSDGYDEGLKPNDDRHHFLAQFKDLGSKYISHLIRSLGNQCYPITCVVHTMLLPWAADIAHNLDLPAYLLWIQPATLFMIYYHYFHGYEHLINTKTKEDPFGSIDIPGLLLFKPQELPSFLLPSSADIYSMILEILRQLFGDFKKGKVLVNTFDALESDILRGIDGIELTGFGPLIPSAFLEGKESRDATFCSDKLTDESMDIIKWLDSKPVSSVVYVAFGSISILTTKQMEEISLGLIEKGKPFLWVVRFPENGSANDGDTDFLSRVKAKGEGQVVSWCSQAVVLQHPSVGCFVSHCGWNSTLESIAAGVPLVAFPQWSDQGTNAKLIEEVWRIGVRVKKNEDGVLEGKELKRCLDIVMGDSGEEIRNNARKWRDLAREAAAAGGSSDRNLSAFVKEVSREVKCISCNSK